MPDWFDAEVDSLERRTRHRRGSDDLVLFYGSSTFTLWDDLETRFPGVCAVNHGFGGATLADCLEYFDRLVTPMAPSAVVLYAGDNDLDNGASPELVRERVEHFLLRKRAALGPIPMAYVSIKISPARFHIMHKIAYANRIIERSLFSRADVHYLDITRRMIGRGIADLFACYDHDPLHMSRRGYAIWEASLAEWLAGRIDGVATAPTAGAPGMGK
jgi:lysophospholipase L1-like esterase